MLQAVFSQRLLCITVLSCNTIWDCAPPAPFQEELYSAA